MQPGTIRTCRHSAAFAHVHLALRAKVVASSSQIKHGLQTHVSLALELHCRHAISGSMLGAPPSPHQVYTIYTALCQSTSLGPTHHLLRRIETLHGAGGAVGCIGRKTRLPTGANSLQLPQVLPAARARMRSSRRVSRLARLHARVSSCPPKNAADLCNIRNASLRHAT